MKKLFLLNIIGLIVLYTWTFDYNSFSLNVSRVNYYGERLERASEFLIKRSNYNDIPYNYGNKGEMYSIHQDDTYQSLEGYEYRYLGKKANNYIYFNCQSVDNCELWRIIGVFQVEDEMGNLNYRIKIMKNDSIGKMIFDDNSNDFVNSDIQYYLNHDYYDTLTDESRKMIGMTKYYLSGSNNSNYSGTSFYSAERGNFTNSSIDLVAKIGLVYPSDYLYTYYQLDDECYNNLSNCKNGKRSWMGEVASSQLWSLTPEVNSNSVYIISSNGGNVLASVNNSYNVYPVLYLRFDTIINGGDGSILNPYRVSAIKKGNVIDENDLIGDKSIVSVDDTLSNKSLIIIISSLMLILVGLIIILKNYMKSINNKKNI